MRRYETSKGNGSMLDMDDLLEKTHQLIAADADIRHRLAQHYRFALIDEFQDTDPLQWKIIRSLASLDGQMAGDKLFIVGDPKQSIYSFRAADVTIFARVRAAIAEANAAHERESRPFCDDGEVLDASPHPAAWLPRHGRKLPHPRPARCLCQRALSQVYASDPRRAFSSRLRPAHWVPPHQCRRGFGRAVALAARRQPQRNGNRAGAKPNSWPAA